MVFHLIRVKKQENKNSIQEINGFTDKISTGKLILYSVGLVFFAFLIWGATQPVNTVITERLLFWLPEWFTEQDFNHYATDKIIITLILNLVLNGFLAPYVEEIYFRGYLLSRMVAWGKYAFVVNALSFLSITSGNLIFT